MCVDVGRQLLESVFFHRRTQASSPGCGISAVSTLPAEPFIPACILSVLSDNSYCFETYFMHTSYLLACMSVCPMCVQCLWRLGEGRFPGAGVTVVSHHEC